MSILDTKKGMSLSRLRSHLQLSTYLVTISICDGGRIVFSQTIPPNSTLVAPQQYNLSGTLFTT